MITHFQKAADHNGKEKEGMSPEAHQRADSDGTCRCKETSRMTPSELLKLMMNDLAVWKKTKKESGSGE